MKSKSSFLALGLALLASFSLTACTSAQNLGSRGPTDTCTLASACCAALPVAIAPACASQVSLAEAQSDGQTACGVLLQGYQGEGFCAAAATGDGGVSMGSAPDGSVMSSSEAGGETSTSGNEGVTLAVASSQQISSLADYPTVDGLNLTVSAGQIVVAVALELADDGAESLPLTSTLFAIETTNGIQYPGDFATTQGLSGCDPSTSLASGHTLDCTVYFYTPAGAVTTTLAYQLPDGSSVTVPLTTTCSLCGSECVDLQTDPYNCGSCGNGLPAIPAANPAPPCENGQIACTTPFAVCNGMCVDSQTDEGNCGGCGRECVNDAACVNGQCGG